MITIDGSHGEGGGQVLRSSLSLSLVTGQPFRIVGIRAGRRKPGLLRQHLTAVNAAVEISDATVDGNHMGSAELTFAPQAVRHGHYHVAIGTAGSATLVLQTLLPALVLADGSSTLQLEGGTHNPYAPPFDFIEKCYLPLIEKMGPRVQVRLENPGFYPAGGGRLQVAIEPVAALRRLDIMERGALLRQRAVAMVSQIPRDVADRELSALGRKITLPDEAFEVIQVTNSPGPGNVLMLTCEHEHVAELFTGIGERGLPAERVVASVVKPYREYIASGMPVGRYLADQLLLPMALAGGGEYMTLPPSRHMLTNIETIKAFLDVEPTIEQIDRLQWHVSI